MVEPTLTPSRRVRIPFSLGMKHGPSIVKQVSSSQYRFELGLAFESA